MINTGINTGLGKKLRGLCPVQQNFLTIGPFTQQMHFARDHLKDVVGRVSLMKHSLRRREMPAFGYRIQQLLASWQGTFQNLASLKKLSLHRTEK